MTPAAATPSGFTLAARLVRAMTALYLVAAGTLFCLGLALYATEIVLRYGFGTGFPEYYEIVGIGFIYVFLLGAVALYARGEDIMIDLVHTRLPVLLRLWIELVVHLAVATTMALVAVQAWRLAVAQWAIPTPLLEISEGVKVIPLIVAAASIAFASAVETWAAALSLRRGTRIAIWTKPFFDQTEEEE